VLYQGTAKANSSLRDWEPRATSTSRAGASPARATSHCTYARQTGQMQRWWPGPIRSPDGETS